MMTSFLGRLVFHEWLKLLLLYILSVCFMGLIHFYAAIYKPWPDIHSVLIGLGQPGSPLGLSALICKMGIGL